MSEIEHIKKALERERKARKAAERIMEEKSRELYEINRQLLKLNADLEQEVVNRISEVKRSEEQLRGLFENHPFPMLVYDLSNFKVLAVNQTAIDQYGYSKAEFYKLTIKDLHVGDDDQLNAHLEAVKAGVFKVKHWQHFTKYGQVIDVEIAATSIEYEGKLARLVLIKDITLQKKIEAEKQLNEKRYKDLVESVSDIIYTCDSDGHFLYVNPTAEHICGYHSDELEGQHFTVLIRPDYHKRVMRYYREQLDSNTMSSYLEFPVLTKSGDEIWIGQTVDINQVKGNGLEFIALARNITERKRVQESLKRSEEKYRNIMENMELGLLEVNNAGVITNAYPKFCQLSGYSQSELLGQHAETLLLPPEFQVLMAKQNKNRSQGEPGVYEVQLIRKDGSRVWIIISGAPYFDHHGNVAGSIGIHLDISDRKKIEDELLGAKEIAEESVKSKELFMANMSHEIRTPMNAIIGMGELLQKTPLNEKQTQYIGAIKTSADNLLIIINDILDFSKIESGELSLEEVPIHLPDLFENVRKTVELKIEEKGLELIFEVDDRIETYLADPTRLSQVLTNLMGNAVKFTESGSIRVKCGVLKSYRDKDLLIFSVKDTGIGIQPSKQQHIFESFKQADESTTRKYGGTGLGLAISKQLIELMGGELKLVSARGIGSDFYFSVEFKKMKTPRQNKPRLLLDQSRVKGLSVLLVEDHEINRFMAQTILENWDCVIDIAVNGKEAVDAVQQKTYDIILMDMRMPELNGLEATKVIRENLGIETPIIALTANAIKGDSERCIEVGMTDYISKPFKQEVLLEKLIQYTSPKQMDEQVEAISATPTDHFIEEGQLMDLTKLKISTNNDVGFMRKMIQLFLDDTPSQLENLSAAMSAKDFVTVGKIAHRLKPSIDHLAMKSMQNLVRQVEDSDQLLPAAALDLSQVFIDQIQQLMRELTQWLQ